MKSWRFWMREVAGWALVLLGLYLFLGAYNQLEERMYWQPMATVLMAIFVFRGGIQLLKVAVAARICSQAQGPVAGDNRKAPAALNRSRPRPSVIPRS